MLCQVTVVVVVAVVVALGVFSWTFRAGRCEQVVSSNSDLQCLARWPLRHTLATTTTTRTSTRDRAATGEQRWGRAYGGHR